MHTVASQDGRKTNKMSICWVCSQAVAIFIDDINSGYVYVYILYLSML